ncbi:TRAP transporter substrate-binding protein DctP [Brevibacterium album]|uniref:TRAP transporter substrate-binding protein n=1 Tax=Brevibacterium album TaxID=417948 RepID=UPI00041328A8|nr:TRAP transporter substrate-binding protein DctP [Brevibacterium album]
MLKLADSYSTTHMFARHGVEGFLGDVAAPGEGSLEVEYYPSGQLGSPRDIADLTQAGTIDIAPAAAAYLSDQLPLSSVTDLPGLAEDPCQASAALLDLLDEDGVLYREEYEPRGLRPLWVAVLPGYEIMTANRPVREPADLAGLTIRSSGGAMDANVDALGAAPVSMPAADAYEALSRHTVDGISFPYASVTPYRLEEVLRYSTKGLNAGSFAIPYVIAEDVWQELTAAERERISSAADAASARLCAGITEENPAAEAVMREAGVVFTEFEGAQKEEFAALLDPVRQEWAESYDAAGLPGTRVLKAYEDALTAHAPESQEG